MTVLDTALAAGAAYVTIYEVIGYQGPVGGNHDTVTVSFVTLPGYEGCPGYEGISAGVRGDTGVRGVSGVRGD